MTPVMCRVRLLARPMAAIDCSTSTLAIHAATPLAIDTRIFMDPNHPVIILCVEGMQAESEGRLEDARRLFRNAWEARTDDYHASVAAHFVARQAATHTEKLHWNQIALDHADAVADQSVRSFYPSLYLNLGHSHELLGNTADALRYFLMAEARLDDMEPGPLGDLVRSGIAAGRARLAEKEAGSFGRGSVR